MRPHYRTGERDTSAIWLAETSVANSARKITSGDVNDHSPSFHPISGEIYFLSDREGIGERSSIYKLKIGATIDTNPIRVDDLDSDRNVTSFALSPDGSLLAFTAVSEPSEVEQQSKGPGQLWRDKNSLASLCVVDLHGGGR